MKKLLLFICVLFSFNLQSQRTGISYQALIINPDGEQLPGYNNQNAPLVNTAICLEFIIINENNSVEYSEYQKVTTDKFGMVNLTIGTGDYAGGSSGGWNNIIWSEKSKKLRVRLDTSGNCSGFVEISNQNLTSVPFALFAPGQEGRDGESAYEIWISEGNSGTVQQFLESLKGDKGDDGLSAYQVWKELGNSETEQDFLDSLKGEKGDEGKSAYQIWLDAGNTGTEEEFLASLKGSDGGDGTSAKQSLIKTTIEAAGGNCANGGIKIETGIDSNADGVLDDDEVNASQTKYLCNGSDGEDGINGKDGTDGTSGGAMQLCNEFDLVAVYRSSVGVSDVSHDSSSINSYYPGALNGNASSYISGASLNLTGLDTYKVVLSSSNDSNLPWFGISIKAYDYSGQELTFSVRKEQMWWYDTSYSDQSGQTGGGYKNFNSTSAQQVFFYWKGKAYEENIGAQWTDRGGSSGKGKWHINLEVSSNSKIARLVVDYSPATSPRGAASITSSVVKYLCSTISSSSSTSSSPPEGLKVGDEWGGGIVVYVDESGKRGRIMAKEEYVSGVLQWSTNLKYTNSQSDGFANNTYRNDRIGRDNSQAVLDYYTQNDGSAPAFEYARDIVIDGYDDWYVPTQWEINQAHTILVNSYSQTLEFLWTSTEKWNTSSESFARIKTGNSSYGFASKTKNLTEGQAKIIPFRSFGE